MTVVYIDLLFFLNLVANYLLLLGTGRIAGAVLNRWRLALGAAVGAAYAALVFLPGMGWLAQWPCKIVVGVAIVLAAYGGERRLLRIAVTFFAGSAALAGLVLGAELLGSTALTLQNGILYSAVDIRLLLLLFVLCYIVMALFFRRTGRHTGRELVSLEIEIADRRISLTALMDTGHTLTDPANNRPVVVAEAERFAFLLPEGTDPRDPIEAVRRCAGAGLSAVLVPYRAVGVERGLLLALRSQSVTARGKPLGKLLIALSPTPVGEGYQALIGGL